MKLLIVTQAVDQRDPALGFFVRWIEEFAKHCDKITVICLREGEHTLPPNVRVHSLGKEGGVSRVKYVLNFYTYIWQLRYDYDAVFVHMNPEYVVLGGTLWRMLGKHIGLWYVHKSVNLKLRIAELLVNDIFTASREGFILKTSKLHVVGHGIDTALFRAPVRPFGTQLRIVSVGRITPIKNPDSLIEIVALLKYKGINVTATFIGAPVHPSDMVYLEMLKKLARERGVSDQVTFFGSVPYVQMSEQYRHFDVSVNLCSTGGMDKAVLESMAAGLLVFASNQSFAGLFGPYADELLFPERDATACADRIATFMHNVEAAEGVRVYLQHQVETMSVRALIPRILSSYETSL